MDWRISRCNLCSDDVAAIPLELCAVAIPIRLRDVNAAYRRRESGSPYYSINHYLFSFLHFIALFFDAIGARGLEH